MCETENDDMWLYKSTILSEEVKSQKKHIQHD